jgi:hypothetical protein
MCVEEITQAWGYSSAKSPCRGTRFVLNQGAQQGSDLIPRIWKFGEKMRNWTGIQNDVTEEKLDAISRHGKTNVVLIMTLSSSIAARGMDSCLQR